MANRRTHFYYYGEGGESHRESTARPQPRGEVCFEYYRDRNKRIYSRMGIFFALGQIVAKYSKGPDGRCFGKGKWAGFSKIMRFCFFPGDYFC